MYQDILYQVTDQIATITFNRPDYGNAFSSASFHEIPAALEKAGTDPQVRAIVITGQGRIFCAGGDINQFKDQIQSADGPGLPKSLFEEAGGLALAIRACPKPVIASVNGAAAGAGLGVALASDFRIMEESSSLVTSFVFMGFPGDTGVGYFLQQMLGTAKATELLMLSPKVKGVAAKELGLATEVVADGQLQEATYAFAKKIANLPTLALGQQKAMLNSVFYADLEKYIQLEIENMHQASKTTDHQEAVMAFLEKRPAEFRGE